MFVVLNWQLIRHVCVTGCLSSMLQAYCCLHLFIESNFICDIFRKAASFAACWVILIMTVALEVGSCKMGTCSMPIWPCKKCYTNWFQKPISELLRFNRTVQTFIFFLQTCFISANTRLIALYFDKLNMTDFTQTCAIPSFPGCHTEGPQTTDTILRPCATLPEFQAVSFSRRSWARSVHIVGTAASSHELFLMSYCYFALALWGRWLCLS
jgi:hypothetical protein